MKIHHNKKLFYIILLLITILIVLIYFIVNNPTDQNNEDSLICNIDSDCVPSECCHPDSCINKAQAPDCDDIECTMVCEPDTLDCGQGNCQCIDNKCEALLVSSVG